MRMACRSERSDSGCDSRGLAEKHSDVHSRVFLVAARTTRLLFVRSNVALLVKLFKLRISMVTPLVRMLGAASLPMPLVSELTLPAQQSAIAEVLSISVVEAGNTEITPVRLRDSLSCCSCIERLVRRRAACAKSLRKTYQSTRKIIVSTKMLILNPTGSNQLSTSALDGSCANDSTPRTHSGRKGRASSRTNANTFCRLCVRSLSLFNPPGERTRAASMASAASCKPCRMMWQATQTCPRVV
mmetsp:Transcript_68783/g.165083  ORF Transcript_68783/g.165083 Transcript_68783/m.165083 type:complete len:243 (-) Transcript_68783:89-817(-)